MRLLPLALLPAFLLAACVGQLRDFVGPVSNTTSPQLLRFGLDLAQARCVGTRLGDRLRPRQLRMFARAMSGVHDGWFEPGQLTLRDLSYLAAHVPDANVDAALARAERLARQQVSGRRALWLLLALAAGAALWALLGGR